MASWRVDIAVRARADLRDVLQRTVQEFGTAQRRRYAELIRAALGRLRDGPEVPGSQPVGPERPTLRQLRIGRRARHLLVYRAEPGGRIIIIIRILHDAMDLARHLPPSDT